MKTKNVILLGVVGVGAVGAYMFMKNKQKQDVMLAGFMPTTPSTTTGATTSGTTTSGTTTSGTSTSGTTTNLATQSDGVSPSDANINLTNAMLLVTEIKAIDKEYTTPFTGNKTRVGDPNWRNTPEYDAYEQMQRSYQRRREPKVSALAKLGYKLDATGALVKI